MSTKIHCTVLTEDYVEVTAIPGSDRISLDYTGHDCARLTIHDRTEFLAAVEKELDVIIIDRNELPEVGNHRTGGLHAGAYSAHAFDDAETLHRRALAYLAMAKHLEGLSPVEAEQVKALAELIYSTERQHGPVSAEHLAVVLARAGVRVGGDDK